VDSDAKLEAILEGIKEATAQWVFQCWQQFA
jgi:hypothetical protein